MGFNRKIFSFFRNLNRKYRLNLRKEHNDSEVWYMHISPLRLMGGFIALLLVLFIIILTLVAYTPIMTLIPGYSGNKARKEMIDNIIKIDSIERRLNELQVYDSNVSLIMEGKDPVTRNVRDAADSARVAAPEAVLPDAADSALRRQMEGTGIYSLNNSPSSTRTGNQLQLIPPLKGIISTHFSPRDNRFGVGIATATNQQVLAIAEGTVILSTWSPEEQYTIQIQHAGNLVSTYKHSVQSPVATGVRARSGEVIGYTGEGISGEAGKGLFEFELWSNGTPVDPETYIVF